MQTKTFDLTFLNGLNGFTIPGVAGNGQLGWSVSSAGDINGDGFSDLVLGALYGASYVIFGSRNGFPASFNLTNLNGSNGFTILGSSWSVSSAGDVNGDGIADLVLGAPYTNTGTSYVLFGSRSGFPAVFNLNNFNGSNGFTIPGIVASGQLGVSVRSAGDINGDGISDLVLGASANLQPGVSYVIFGNRRGFPAVFNLTNLNGSNGFMIPGIAVGGGLGSSVSSAGDINDDGISDLVLGAPYANILNGTSYVIFGGLASITLTKNNLTIIEGQTVILNNTNLNAIGIIPFDSLAFTVTGVQGGRFTFVNDSATSIFNFTQNQINSAQIQFISDRSNIVAYQVGMVNVTDNRIVFSSIPAQLTFINYLPVVINKPSSQIVTIEEPFSFTLQANQIFNDTDGDPLSYSTSSNGASLPNWLSFDGSQPDQLTFNGTAPFVGKTPITLTASDPLNASISTQFDIVIILANTTVVNEASIDTTVIAGSVVGAVAGLAALVGSFFGFFNYFRNKISRETEAFADLIRSMLNLKDVDNFNSEAGQRFVAIIHNLQKSLQQVGIDPTIMRRFELQQLSLDIAVACRNKISEATDCLGRSVISISDLDSNLQIIVNEVQVLRTGNQKLTA